MLISLGKYLKSLRVKCIKIHIDRNHIRPLTEKDFIMTGDMHVGFKVQLVVEFFIYAFCLGHCQIQKIAKTPEQAHLKMSRPLPSLAAMSLLGKAVPVCGSYLIGSSRLSSSVPVSAGLRNPLGPGDIVLFSQTLLELFDGGWWLRAERGLLLSGPHHFTLVHLKLKLWMWVTM